MIKQAINYAGFGWAVFEISPNSKVPYPKTHGVKDATKRPDIIKTWNPKSNLALATGNYSGVFVLDVDVKHGKNGWATLDQLEKEHNDLPATVQQITPSTGGQLFFRIPEGMRIKNSANTLGEGLDIRGDGGYVLIPPSSIDSKPYEWISDQAPWEIDIAMAPDWLLARLEMSKASEKFEMPKGEIPAGQQDDTMFKFACSLKKQGFTPEMVGSALDGALLKCKQDPDNPFTQRDVARWINSAFNYPDDEDCTDDNDVIEEITASGKKRKIHAHLAKAKKILQTETWIYCTTLKLYYEYQKNYYNFIEKDIVRKKILSYCPTYSPSNRENVLKNIDLIVGHIEQDFNPKNIINFKNCVLDLDKMSIGTHSSNNLLTSKLTFNYDPKAKSELWAKTIDEIFQSNQNNIRTIQEFFGYCFTTETKYEKALYCVGNGSNGKSVMLETLRNLLTPENVSTLSLKDFAEGEATWMLAGKKVNIASETHKKAQGYEDIIKKIISGETITVNKKYCDQLDLRPYCKLVFAANTFPYIDDKSDGFYRRMIIVNFDRKFEEKDQDVNLVSKLKFELSGIFNWCMEGLNRLKERNRFESNAEIRKNIMDIKMQNNPMINFIKESCVFGEHEEILKNDFYKEYKDYCVINGYKPLNKAKLLKDLYQFFPQIDQKRQRIEGQREQFLIGVCSDKKYINNLLKTDEDGFLSTPEKIDQKNEKEGQDEPNWE